MIVYQEDLSFFEDGDEDDEDDESFILLLFTKRIYLTLRLVMRMRMRMMNYYTLIVYIVIYWTLRIWG